MSEGASCEREEDSTRQKQKEHLESTRFALGRAAREEEEEEEVDAVVAADEVPVFLLSLEAPPVLVRVRPPLRGAGRQNLMSLTVWSWAWNTCEGVEPPHRSYTTTLPECARRAPKKIETWAHRREETKKIEREKT